MKPSLSTLLLVFLCLTAMISYGESQYEDEEVPMKQTWPLFSFQMPHYRFPQYHKAMKKPLISPDCIKAKLALSDCVKEKLVSTWFSKPIVEDCCAPISNHKKSCPGFIFKIDELLIPHYIKNACQASGPSSDKHASGPSSDHKHASGPSSDKHASGPSAGPSAAPADIK